MTTLTVTAKGQVTFRKDVLEHLGVHPGEKIEVEKLPSRRIEVRAVKSANPISGVFGTLKHKTGPRLSVDEMNRIAARSWSGKR
jgi:AbrB family looped-hinge helix DNA binding protein